MKLREPSFADPVANWSNQEIFDRSVHMVVRQGKCASDAVIGCQYRTDDGSRCAVGHLFPKNSPWDDIQGDVFSPQLKEAGAYEYLGLTEEDEERTGGRLGLLSALQSTHDFFARRGLAPETFIAKANAVAKVYNLTPYTLPEAA